MRSDKLLRDLGLAHHPFPTLYAEAEADYLRTGFYSTRVSDRIVRSGALKKSLVVFAAEGHGKTALADWLSRRLMKQRNSLVVRLGERELFPVLTVLTTNPPNGYGNYTYAIARHTLFAMRRTYGRDPQIASAITAFQHSLNNTAQQPDEILREIMSWLSDGQFTNRRRPDQQSITRVFVVLDPVGNTTRHLMQQWRLVVKPLFDKTLRIDSIEGIVIKLFLPDIDVINGNEEGAEVKGLLDDIKSTYELVRSNDMRWGVGALKDLWLKRMHDASFNPNYNSQIDPLQNLVVGGYELAEEARTCAGTSPRCLLQFGLELFKQNWYNGGTWTIDQTIIRAAQDAVCSTPTQMLLPATSTQSDVLHFGAGATALTSLSIPSIRAASQSLSQLKKMTPDQRKRVIKLLRGSVSKSELNSIISNYVEETNIYRSYGETIRGISDMDAAILELINLAKSRKRSGILIECIIDWRPDLIEEIRSIFPDYSIGSIGA